MIKTKLGISISVLLLVNCNNKINKTEDITMNEITKNTNTSIDFTQNTTELECTLLYEALLKNNFKPISKQQFIERNMYYYGAWVEDYFRNKEDESQILPYPGDDNYIDKKRLFLNTMMEYLFHEISNIEEAKLRLSNTMDHEVERFFAYNKLLYNDDPLAVLYFLLNADDAYVVVVNYDYNKNEELVDRVIDQLEFNPIYWQNAIDILLYKDYRVNEYFIKKCIERRGNEIMSDILYSLIEHWDEIENVSLQAKVEAIVSVLNNLKRSTSSLLEDGAYNFIDFINTVEHSYLIDEIEQSATCTTETREIIHDYQNIHTEEPPFEARLIGYIKDKDGFTNLRKSFVSDAKIIRELKNGTKVFILEMNGKRWLIQTEDGTKGYIFYDRVYTLGRE
ncbi:SH3 domain-containing protein [Myroides odoratus]|uniref:SH3 domain-containing protein n=1 Tax=Myroides odoratus TaxID=256 RepID=UPI0033401851